MAVARFFETIGVILFGVSAIITLISLLAIGLASALLAPLAVLALIALFFPAIFFIALSFWIKGNSSVAKQGWNREGGVYEYVEYEDANQQSGKQSFTQSFKQAYRYIFDKVRVIKFRR